MELSVFFLVRRYRSKQSNLFQKLNYFIHLSMIPALEAITTMVRFPLDARNTKWNASRSHKNQSKLVSDQYIMKIKDTTCKKKRKCKKIDVDISISPNQPKPSGNRNPARHAAGESSLQSESSLKGHLRILGPQAASQVTHASEWPPRRSGWARNGGDLTGLGGG